MTDSPLAGLHAVGYCRVSTDDKGQTTGQQERAIKEWASARGVIVDSIFTDEKSGSCWPRPGLSAALVTLATGSASMLVCYDQSRLTRDAPTHLPLIQTVLGSKIIRYVSAGDSDPESLGGRITAAIKYETDREERKILSERTKMGMAYRRDVLHQHMGRPIRLYITDSPLNDSPAGRIAPTTIILTPNQVRYYATQGWTPSYVSNRLLKISPATFLTALRAAGLSEEYYNILQKGVEQKGRKIPPESH